MEIFWRKLVEGPRHGGDTCDGVRNDSSALEAGVNASKILAKGGEVLIPGVTRAGREMTIPQNVAARFPQCAALSPTRGKAVKVQGQWLAGAAATIDLSQGGTVSFADNGAYRRVVELPCNADRNAAQILNTMINDVPDVATLRFGVIQTEDQHNIRNGRGPDDRARPALRIFIVSNGGVTAVAAGGNIMRTGVLSANFVTAFYCDPASGRWW